MGVGISFAAPVSLCGILSLILFMVMPHGHMMAAVPPGITPTFQENEGTKRLQLVTPISSLS